MPAQLLLGAGLSSRLRGEIEDSIVKLIAAGGAPPRLATLLVGADASSRAYRTSIVRTMAKVRIDYLAVDLPADCGHEDFVGRLDELNLDRSVSGVLVLMPLPDHLPAALVLEHLSPLKDVDGITPTNAGRLHMGLPSLRPSTPQGGVELLDHYGVEIEGRHVVIVGRSNVVGRPLASLLLQRNATVTLCHRRTVDLWRYTRNADILCCAAGHAGLIRGDMVKPGAAVLDFGVNVVADHIVGDVEFADVAEVAGKITPVPGGTGPVTALVLARNTVAAGFVALSGSLDHADLARAVARPATAHLE